MKKSIVVNSEKESILLDDLTTHSVSFEYKGKKYHFNLKAQDGDSLVLGLGEKTETVFYDGENALVSGHELTVGRPGQSRKKGGDFDHGSMTAPMPGKIFKVATEVGAVVKKGDVLVIMEAMKMEHPIKASSDGVVKNLYYKEGQLVDAKSVLVELENLDA